MSDVSTATGTQELPEGAVPSTEPHGVAGEAPVIEAEGQTEETGVASGTLATTADTDAEVYDLEAQSQPPHWDDGGTRNSYSDADIRGMTKARGNLKRRLTRVRHCINVHLEMLGSNCFEEEALLSLDEEATRTLFNRALTLKDEIDHMQDKIRYKLENMHDCDDKRLDEQDAWERSFEEECKCIVKLGQCLKRRNNLERERRVMEEERRAHLQAFRTHGSEHYGTSIAMRRGSFDALHTSSRRDSSKACGREGVTGRVTPARPVSPLEPSEESLQPSGAAANTSAAANAPVGDAEPDDCSNQLQLQVTCEDKLSQPPHLECVASQTATVGSLPQQTQASSRSQKLSATPSQPVHVHSGSPVPKPRARTRERTQQHSPEPSRSPGLDTDDIEEANAPVQQAFAPQLDYVYDHSSDYGHQHTLKPEAQPFVPAYVNEHAPRSGHDDDAAGLEGFDGEVQQPSQIGTHRPNSPQHTMAREALTLEQVIQSAFVNAAHALTQVQPAAATVSIPTAQFKLKPMELPTFDGQVTEWPDFWDMFETAVDSQPLADVVKLTYLKGALTSTAAKSLSGLATTNTNYAVAVRLLKEKYGQTDDIIAALYSKLQRMHTTTSKHSDIRHTVDCLERILRQLSATGVAVDQQPLLVQHILSKFPTEVLTKLEEWRTSMGQQSWTVPTLRSSLQRYAEILQYQNKRPNATSRLKC